MKVIRPKPDYFAVGYYGMGFPSFLRVSTRINTHPPQHSVDEPHVKTDDQYVSKRSLSSQPSAVNTYVLTRLTPTGFGCSGGTHLFNVPPGLSFTYLVTHWQETKCES